MHPYFFCDQGIHFKAIISRSSISVAIFFFSTSQKFVAIVTTTKKKSQKKFFFSFQTFRNRSILHNARLSSIIQYPCKGIHSLPAPHHPNNYRLNFFSFFHKFFPFSLSTLSFRHLLSFVTETGNPPALESILRRTRRILLTMTHSVSLWIYDLCNTKQHHHHHKVVPKKYPAFKPGTGNLFQDIFEYKVVFLCAWVSMVIQYRYIKVRLNRMIVWQMQRSKRK